MEAAGLNVLRCSSLWRTDPWPSGAQPDYYNAVVAVDPGDRSPQELYELLRAIETRYGRERREKWASRTLDLDIVAIDALAGALGGIILPHPHMHERGFVLAPLAEVEPRWRHPALGKTAAELLGDLPTGVGYRLVGPLPSPASG
jgi:2-amino-4-hydroxy-6-hydroxymethyldihydropteridine diphosphokinase